MNKKHLIQAITDALREDFENFQKASREARSGGNDAESKAEGKYDTRSTEENYLADGLAKQAFAAAEAAAALERLVLKSFDDDTPIDLSALVQLRFPEETLWFFLAPAGGGVEVNCEGVDVTVLTPEAPLGAQLQGQKSGDQTTSPKSKILKVE